MPTDRAGNSLNAALDLGITSGRKVVRDWINRGDRDDFYSFRLNKSSNVRLNLDQLKSNLDLELLDQNGNRIARSKKRKNKRERIQESLEAGTYYIRVYRRGGKTKYRLKTIIQEHASDPTNPDTPPPVDPKDGTEDPTVKAERVELINEVLRLTNFEREQVGLASLTLNQQLNNAAQSQSKNLAENDFFAHTSPDGTTLANRLSNAEYRYATAGENIAAGQVTAEQVVREWMASPGHKANILNSAFTELGVGYYELENDTGEINYNRYWTQNFGKPAS